MSSSALCSFFSGRLNRLNGNAPQARGAFGRRRYGVNLQTRQDCRKRNLENPQRCHPWQVTQLRKASTSLGLKAIALDALNTWPCVFPPPAGDPQKGALNRTLKGTKGVKCPFIRAAYRRCPGVLFSKCFVIQVLCYSGALLFRRFVFQALCFPGSLLGTVTVKGEYFNSSRCGD